MKKLKGFTVIELTICSVLIGIMSALAIPSLQHFLLKAEIEGQSYSLMRHLNTARMQAIVEHTRYTLCPSKDSINCTTAWTSGYLLFDDRNADHVRDPSERIFHAEQGPSNGAHLSWRSFQHKPALQFVSTGITDAQNGSFVICPNNNDVHYARAIIVAKMGKIRLSSDKNHDGIDEDANGDALTCS